MIVTGSLIHIPIFRLTLYAGNAVVHREYALTGNYIRVTMYDDRLEIFSSGKLPNLVTVDNIRETRFSRNPQLARVLTEFGLVRELIEGVKRIYADMQEQNLEAPKYSENEQGVLLVLKNNIQERNVKQTISVTDDGNNEGNREGNLSETECKVLSAIKNDVNISAKRIAVSIGVSDATVERVIKKLKQGGYIIREGSTRGHWRVLK